MGFFDRFAPKGEAVDGGVRGTAQVVSITEYRPGSKLQQAHIDLVVSGEGFDPTAVVYDGLVQHDRWLRAGQQVPVLVDRANPQRFSILWEDVPTPAEASQAAAAELAAELKRKAEGGS
jgi:hypothetical protein